MPTFLYNALDPNGQAASGSLPASSRVAAMEQLIAQGLTPTSLKTANGNGNGNGKADGNGGNHAASIDQPSRSPQPGVLTRRRVSAGQVEAFTRELANLLAAGVPLGRALFILKRESASPAAQAQWTAIHDDVVAGHSLADALARFPRSFPSVFVAMIRAGETGGFIDVVLTQIADFRTREKELTGKIKSAMIYPAAVAVLAISVLAFLLTFFIPNFSTMFQNLGGQLPLLTRIIVAASNLVLHDGLYVLVVVALLALLLWRAVHSHRGRRTFEQLCLKIPLFGTTLARFALVRFAHMLGTLLAAGVSMVQSLQVAREAIGNQTLADTVSDAITDVKRGETLSRSLSRCDALFPPSVIEMITVAEESGRLEKELLRLAQTYELELDRRLRMLVALVEPAMLFVMASIVGTIVVGMLLPIFMLQELMK